MANRVEFEFYVDCRHRVTLILYPTASALQSNVTPNPNEFLSSCPVIDASASVIVKQAADLAADSAIETAKRCFEFVRDQIRHSSDHRLNPVTCIASEVLEHRTGYCYAKSHLLCALLRANNIPAGLCYQRLSIDGVGRPYCLHGLNAVFLPDYGWYRIDARGNRSDVDAQFSPPTEKLAFDILVSGESDLPGIFRQPHSSVTNCLFQSTDWPEVAENLPDVTFDSWP